MKLDFNEENRNYYSESFIKGFECGVDRQYQEDMRVLEDIKAEIQKLIVYYTTDTDKDLISLNAVNRVFDNYTAEGEPEGDDLHD